MDDCDLPSESLPTLSALTRTLRRYRLVKRLLSGIWVITVAAMVLVFLAADHHLLPSIPDASAEPLALVCACVIGCPLSALMYRCRKALRNLFSTSDVRITPILFEFLVETVQFDEAYSKEEFEEFRVEIRTALTRLLPKLRQEHASLFGSRSRASWRRFLDRTPSRPDDAELSFLILQALEVLGDAQDLEVLDRIVEGRSVRSLRFKQAACICVAAIRERLQQQQDQASLLRPADNWELSGRTLLRPQESRTGSSPEQLLRATYSPTTNTPGNGLPNHSVCKSPE